MQGFPLLSLPDLAAHRGRPARAGVRRSRHQGGALGGARASPWRRSSRRFRCSPASTRRDCAFQFVEQLPWIPAFHSTYYLGVDGISLPLILLTTFITIPVVIAAWTVIEQRPAQYYAAFLIMEGLMIGVFSALDGLLFYFFWEAMLIPMFLIIGVWGGPRRVYATIKFFLYTFLGSVFMLVALIYMYAQDRRLQHRRVPRAAADRDRADVDLLRVPRGLRRQDSDGAGAHVVAGCARRSAHRRLGGAGRHHAEDGRLRFPALQRCPSRPMRRASSTGC